jgi:hypothetical protein
MQTSSLDDYDPQVMVPSLQTKEAQPNSEHKYGQMMTNLAYRVSLAAQNPAWQRWQGFLRGRVLSNNRCVYETLYC